MTTELHELQKFQIKRIHRNQITTATYNPRTIDDDARKRLGKNLETEGLLDTLVWNEATGNLVSGHQRIEKLDKYHFKKHKNYDYSLDVAVVNLTLKKEIEQNIFFNNARAQGYFDESKMLEIFKETDLPKIDFTSAGLIDDDISYYSIQLDLDKPLENKSIDSIINDFEQLKEDKKQAISPEEYEARKAAVKDVKKEVTKNEVDTSVTLTFSNQSAKRDFMKLIGEIPESPFIKGEIFAEKFFSDRHF